MSRVTQRPKLGQFLSTAICGNNILSSVLYVCGVSIFFAGYYAPLVLLAVAAVLFFYRAVYREVVEALPINGGAYNALLNATPKTVAAVAGVMSLLSYVATAVISAKTAIAYLFEWASTAVAPFLGIGADGLGSWTLPAVLILLFAFAVIVAIGARDSAKAAGVIFVFHVTTLVAFIALGGLLILTYGPEIGRLNELATLDLVARQGGLLKTLFLAFSASLLGVAGFESSANFVEEQQHGVFAKTLRNMTFGVAILNPLIAIVILRLLPLSQIIAQKDFLLGAAALRMGGMFFLAWIAFDAFLVLSGALMSSYIGATNLAKRMTLDACLPRFLQPAHQTTEGSPRIVFAFFGLCASILFLTHGDLLPLAGVYTISFLGVMSLFAVANLLLRATRSELKRPYRAPFPFIIIALCATIIGIMGNIAIDPTNSAYFLVYFLPATFFVLSVLYKKDLYETCAKFFRPIRPLNRYFAGRTDELVHGHITVFIHHLGRLYTILEYIKRNESARKITLVHCNHHHPHFVDKTEQTLATLKEAGFFTDFEYRVEYLDEPFGAHTLDAYAKRKRIQKSSIFMGSIRRYHDFTYEDLGGVRIIF